jgi:signal transduction histidine kinase
VAWFSPDWVGWVDGPNIVRSVAAIVASLLLPLVVHLALGYPTGRLDRPRRAIVVAVYGVTACLALVKAMVRDPLFDRHCWNDCTADAVVVRSVPELARVLDGALLRFTIAAGLLVAGVCVVRLARASAVARRMSAVVVVPAAAALLALAASAVLLATDPAERPDKAPFAALHRALAGTLVALAAGVTLGAIGAARSRRAVAELGAMQEPGQLQATLARSLGDPSLKVGYWLDSARRFADGAGKPFERTTGRDRATTTVARNGQPVAVVVHDRAVAGRVDLATAIGSTTRLAIDNERLRAEALAQLEEIRQSQARIVAAADDARRRLERDLHDGAQQRLLAASYALRLAAVAARRDGKAKLAVFADEVAEEAKLALSELRTLADGIHPAALTEAGLGMALQTFIGGTAIPVELADLVTARYDPVVETTAYVVVAQSVEVAARDGATHAIVKLADDGDTVAVRVEHDGAVAADDLADVADRVGAAGGSIEVGEHDVLARIPCAL